MHIITRKRLNKFAEKYPDTENALADWYHLIKQNNFTNFAELKAIFSSTDKVGKLTVFNIGGNKYRLITKFEFLKKTVYIKFVLTHKQYDKAAWINEC